MQYSDTTNKNGLLQRCEFWTGVGDAGITGDSLRKAQFTQAMNNWYHKVVTMILDSRDDVDFDDPNLTDQPTFTFPLKASQRDYNLALSEKILKIKRVDVCWNGTGNTCYKARRLDSSEIQRGLGNDSDVDDYFTEEDPRYDLMNNGYTIKLYPQANATHVTNSGVIRVESVREIDEFTTSDTTQEPGFDEPFHEMLAIGASYEWLLVNETENATLISRLEQMLADYEGRLRRHYGMKVEDTPMPLLASNVNYK